MSLSLNRFRDLLDILSFRFYYWVLNHSHLSFTFSSENSSDGFITCSVSAFHCLPTIRPPDTKK